MIWLLWWFACGIVGWIIGSVVDYVLFNKGWKEQGWTFGFALFFVAAGLVTLYVAMRSLIEGAILKRKGK